jgi:Tfp pilus assembly protein PilX
MNVWEISNKIAYWYDTVPGGRITVGLFMLVVLCLFLLAMSRIERMKERKALRIKQQRKMALLESERQLRGGAPIWHV